MRLATKIELLETLLILRSANPKVPNLDNKYMLQQKKKKKKQFKEYLNLKAKAPVHKRPPSCRFSEVVN